MRARYFLFLLFVFWVVPVKASNLPISGKAEVSLVQGTVNCVREGTKKILAQNDTLAAPAQLIVEDNSKLELVLADGSVLRFSGGTECELVAVKATEQKRNVKVDVALGDCWASVEKFLGSEDSFEVKSPTAVAGVAGTRYRLHVNEVQSSSYLVYNGSIKVGYRPVSPEYEQNQGFSSVHPVQGPKKISGPKEVSMQEWIMIVKQGYRVDVSSDGALYEPVKFDREKDLQNPWVEWNMQRDSKMGFMD